MLRKNCFLYLVLLSFLTGACTTQKKLAYFKSVTSESAGQINDEFQTAHEARIVAGDMLIITVTGLDPTAVAPFNMPVISYSNPGSDQIYSTPSLQSYLVDVDGNIDFPVIGTFKIAGYTKSEAVAALKKELEPFLKDAIVTIKFLNYKVTVIGEVARPGQYTINNERVTVLDALGLAGDMTPYGKRNNVLITRENNGKLEFARLNLNSEDVFTSPYYYLQQNDIVYVEPNKAKAGQREINSNTSMSVWLSAVSILATISSLIVTATK